MNGLVHFKLCKLTDEELVYKSDELVDNLYKNNSLRERTLARHIPARPNEDFDLVIGELVRRFDVLRREVEDLRKRDEDISGTFLEQQQYFEKYQKDVDLLHKIRVEIGEMYLNENPSVIPIGQKIISLLGIDGSGR